MSKRIQTMVSRMICTSKKYKEVGMTENWTKGKDIEQCDSLPPMTV